MPQPVPRRRPGAQAAADGQDVQARHQEHRSDHPGQGVRPLRFRGPAALHVEQHDDEEEERDHRARVHQDENEGQEVGVELDEEPGHAGEAEKEAHGAVHRVLAEDHPEGAGQAEDREAGEGELFHGGSPSVAAAAPSSAAFFLSHL